ncbi:MAG TPA: DNA-binding response regulator [Ruminococcaceae bacterium]|nr:DNA-binding response regulator [Oscillospiraceae bacterium]
MKVLIVDDDRLVCESLKIILQADPEIEIVGTGGSGREGVELYERLLPDVLLMDIRMEGMTGLEAGEIILASRPDARILYLTTFSDDDYIIQALRIGAKGYLLKQKFDSIAPAIKAVQSGQSVFGSEIVTRLPDLMQHTQHADYERYGISSKEREVISLVAKGMNNREIAESLFLSEGTVRNYLSSILDKLNLRDRTQLAVFYYNHPFE